MRKAAQSREAIGECPLCGSRAFRLWRKGKDLLLRVSSERFPYVRCAKCDLIFLSVRPTQDAIGVFYPGHYHPYSTPASFSDERKDIPSFIERFFRRVDRGWLQRLREKLQQAAEQRYPDLVVPALQAFYRPPRRGAVLLDFGCGATWYLNRMRHFRWSTIGMDFMESMMEEVRKEGHRAVLVSNEGWEEIQDQSVDAVRMNHVLEHLHDPKPILERLHSKLKGEGRIHVAVPNPDGLSSRLFRSRWFSLEAPRHLMMYSPNRLAATLAAAGFVDIRILHERLPKDFSRSLGYLLQDWRLLTAEEVQRMGDERLLNAWLSPLLWMVGGKGYGDRIHAFARKPGTIEALKT